MALQFDYYDFSTGDATTTSLTPVNIPLMTFPLQEVGATFNFEFVLIVGSSTSAGLKVAITVPPGATFRAWAMGSGATKNGLIVDLMTASGVLGVAFNTFIGQTNFLRVQGGVVNGTFGGVLQLQAAKVTSGTATLSAGSYFSAQRL
jgi:hypothetical protein